MSYGEEMMIERMIDYEIEKLEAARALSDGVWITQEGEHLAISDMESQHIRNCVNMLICSLHDESDEFISDDVEQLRDGYLELFKAELARRYPPMDPAFLNG